MRTAFFNGSTSVARLESGKIEVCHRLDPTVTSTRSEPNPAARWPNSASMSSATDSGRLTKNHPSDVRLSHRHTSAVNSNRRGMLATLGAVAAGLAAVSYVGFADPHGSAWFPQCPTRELTGLLCPACGGLRATHHLLHLDLVGALRDNALVVAAPLLLAAVVIRRPWARWTALAVGAAFTIARNLAPGG